MVRTNLSYYSLSRFLDDKIIENTFTPIMKYQNISFGSFTRLYIENKIHPIDNAIDNNCKFFFMLKFARC